MQTWNTYQKPWFVLNAKWRWDNMKSIKYRGKKSFPANRSMYEKKFKPKNKWTGKHQAPEPAPEPVPEPEPKQKEELVRKYRFTQRDVWRIYQRQKSVTGEKDGLPVCPLCNKAVAHPDGEIDHIIPLEVVGGTITKDHPLNDDSNLQFTHKRCNRLKGKKRNKDAKEYIKSV